VSFLDLVVPGTALDRLKEHWGIGVAYFRLVWQGKKSESVEGIVFVGHREARFEGFGGKVSDAVVGADGIFVGDAVVGREDAVGLVVVVAIVKVMARKALEASFGIVGLVDGIATGMDDLFVLAPGIVGIGGLFLFGIIKAFDHLFEAVAWPIGK